MCLHVCLLFKISSQYAIQPFHHSFALPTLKGKSKQEDQGWGVQGVINGFMYVFIYCAENSNFFPNMGTKITKFFQINRLTLCQPPPPSPPPPRQSLCKNITPPPIILKRKPCMCIINSTSDYIMYQITRKKSVRCDRWKNNKNECIETRLFFHHSNATKFFLSESPYVPTSDGLKLMM